MGNYTKFIYFFHGPNSSKSAKKFFVGGGLGGGWWLGTLQVPATFILFFEATP